MTHEQLATIDALLAEKHFARTDVHRFFQVDFDLKDYDLVPTAKAEKLIRCLKRSRNKETIEKTERRRVERNALYRDLIEFARGQGLIIQDDESVYYIYAQLIRAGFKAPKEYFLLTG
jgi:hypothetical protein